MLETAPVKCTPPHGGDGGRQGAAASRNSDISAVHHPVDRSPSLRRIVGGTSLLSRCRRMQHSHGGSRSGGMATHVPSCFVWRGGTARVVDDDRIAVFTFDGMTIPAGVTLRAVGAGAVALLSPGTLDRTVLARATWVPPASSSISVAAKGARRAIPGCATARRRSERLTRRCRRSPSRDAR